MECEAPGPAAQATAGREKSKGCAVTGGRRSRSTGDPMARSCGTVTNRDLWELLIAETRRHEVRWVKVKGHSGNLLNERVDRLAREAIVTVLRSG